ncbi:2TM domain-containing protein [Gimesia sp.]|uniref:2TM domain-containing protein n=1 Tax=Gimesia sp. TaxID=2024833 RepID=UPI003A8E4482
MAQNEKNYDLAKERVEKKMGFMIHCGIYVVVNAGLIALNLTRSPDKYWFIWPLLGWGIGVVFHAFKVFGPARTASLKEKMIEKEQSKLNQ